MVLLDELSVVITHSDHIDILSLLLINKYYGNFLTSSAYLNHKYLFHNPIENFVINKNDWSHPLVQLSVDDGIEVYFYENASLADWYIFDTLNYSRSGIKFPYKFSDNLWHKIKYRFVNLNRFEVIESTNSIFINGLICVF